MGKFSKEKDFFDRYPELFSRRLLDMKETCMVWGIDLSDKYEDLVFSITLNGNIGIGTTAPNSKMFVYSSLGKELAVN